MGNYVSAVGAFDRDSNYITTRITADADAEYPVEPGRYRLIVSRACPLPGPTTPRCCNKPWTHSKPKRQTPGRA